MTTIFLIFVTITSMAGAFIGVMLAFRIKDIKTLEQRMGGYQPKKPKYPDMPICKPPRKK